jgi:hypothetical protein
LEFGRPGSETNVKLARRYYVEGRPEDFALLETPDGGSYWVERASGHLYLERRSDPLLSEKPMEQEVAVFLALDTIRAFPSSAT